ncbi:hypothetical protein H8N03_05390 [Ramlibacter sp. USB13]|uniref:Uncharacterized protein n=1 Tax=Ramlibacter cellulosilyticus TaxID=2764187 RepID=A0A923SA37_9BURK|nr:hypothetical protein [Ramlibacter cellulosilyticus]MBC5782366.1 hypothetical protein [Ramlibacter cellulosilyticus]
MDLSLLVALSVPVAGLVLSGWYGARRASSDTSSIALASLGVAIVIGVLLTFGQVLVHGLCVDARYCTYRGDGNMSYWFQSFFAIPLYWVVAWIAWHLNRE